MKMTFHFMVISYNSFLKFHDQKMGGGAQHDLVTFKVIYYNSVCYKGTALH